MLLDQFLDSGRHLQAASTQNKNKTFLKKYVRPHIGSMPLKRVTSKVLQDLFDFLLDAKKGSEDSGQGRAERVGGMGLAPNTVKVVRKALAAAFNYAVRHKLVAESPVSGTKIPRVKRSVAASLTLEEVRAFVSVKDAFWYGDAFVFQLHTGLRPQELLSLIWGDVNFEQGTLRVERACEWVRGGFTGFGPPKGSRGERIIELAPEQMDLLRDHFKKQQKAIEGCNTTGEVYGEPEIRKWAEKERPTQSHLYASAVLIFPKPGGAVPNDGVPRSEFKEMLRRAGVAAGAPNYRWYDLRHTHATFLINLGVPLTEIAARMGHSLSTLINTYAHVIKSKRSDAPDLFAKLVPT